MDVAAPCSVEHVLLLLESDESLSGGEVRICFDAFCPQDGTDGHEEAEGGSGTEHELGECTQSTPGTRTCTQDLDRSTDESNRQSN